MMLLRGMCGHVEIIFLNNLSPFLCVLQVAGHYDGVAKVYHPVPGVTIDWPGKTPPKDVPDCGFKDELCPEDEGNCKFKFKGMDTIGHYSK